MHKCIKILAKKIENKNNVSMSDKSKIQHFYSISLIKRFLKQTI